MNKLKQTLQHQRLKLLRNKNQPLLLRNKLLKRLKMLFQMLQLRINSHKTLFKPQQMNNNKQKKPLT
ncbi:hypothetical protein [Streptococcus orisratti]